MNCIVLCCLKLFIIFFHFCITQPFFQMILLFFEVNNLTCLCFELYHNISLNLNNKPDKLFNYQNNQQGIQENQQGSQKNQQGSQKKDISTFLGLEDILTCP